MARAVVSRNFVARVTREQRERLNNRAGRTRNTRGVREENNVCARGTVSRVGEPVGSLIRVGVGARTAPATVLITAEMEK